MTTLRRLLILLAAVAAVIGGTVALAQTGVLSNLAFGRGGEGRPEFGEFSEDAPFRLLPEGGEARPFPPDGQQFERQRGGLGEGGFAGGPRGERMGGGLFGLAEIGKNLLIIGGIVAVVVLGSLGLNWVRRLRRAPA